MGRSNQTGGVISESAAGEHHSSRYSRRRTQILRTAAHQFLALGFESTSMDEIARAVDITKPGLYYYFTSKQDLLAAIINYAQDIHQEMLEEIIAASTSDEELLERALHMHALGVTRSDDAAFSLLGIEETRHLLPDDRVTIARRKRSYIDFLRDTLERIKARGRLRDVDTMAAAYTLAAMVLWIPKWYKSGGRLSAEEVAAEVTKVALNSVLKSD